MATRQVQVGERVGTKWVITSGLKPGDRVVVEGQQKLRSGMRVQPKPYPRELRKGARPMSNFFIRRPIVAMVIAILTVIVGVVMTVTLPVAQFPNIAPPEIRMTATYVGADAKALEQAVATPIEQQINGVDNLDYMYSVNATGSNSTTLFTDFDLKTDPNMDLILTQSREQLAAGQLPPEVNTYGVTIKKATTAPLDAGGYLLAARHSRRDVCSQLRIH